MPGLDTPHPTQIKNDYVKLAFHTHGIRAGCGNGMRQLIFYYPVRFPTFHTCVNTCVYALGPRLLFINSFEILNVINSYAIYY